MARDFRELLAWQLAVALEERATVPAERARAARDTRFSQQLTDAASSAPRNIAEGFGRYEHKQFANFVRIAKASETEVLNQFVVGHRKGYLSSDEFPSYERAAKRAIKMAVGLLRWLESTDTPE